MRRVLLTLTCVVVAFTAATTYADAPASHPPPKKVQPAADQPAASDKVMHDPTQPSEQLRRALGPTNTKVNTTPAMPVIRLRACVIVKGKPPAAIIDVDQVLYTVAAGSKLTVTTTKRPIHLTIDRLDADGVVVHLQNPDETLLLK